jgi:hypothetical protein
VNRRQYLEQAVLESGLKPNQRLILLVLLRLADEKTGRIPAEKTPSLTEIVFMTGLSRSTVAKELGALDEVRWVVRDQPTVEASRKNHERTLYRIQNPASPSRGLELVRDTDQAASPSPALASPSHGPEASAPPGPASPSHGPGASPRGGPYKEVTSSSSSSGRVSVLVAAALGLEEEEAEEVVRRIVRERRPVAPSRYIKTLIESGDIGQFRPSAAQAAPDYTGPRCNFVDPEDGTDYCATCSGHRKHAKHRSAA